MGLILGSGLGPGRVCTETRQPKAMGVDPGSSFNLNVQKGEEEKITKCVLVEQGLVKDTLIKKLSL